MTVENIQFTAKEVLLQLIQEEKEKYPFSFKVKEIIPFLNSNKSQVYDAVKKGKIPGAQKIEGLGWRINRDVFLAWLYSQEKEVGA